MKTKEKMLDEVINMFGLEHPVTIRFCQLLEWGFETTVMRTALQAAKEEYTRILREE